MANVWMHNGFLQVEGQKMSKSLGNFVTIAELLSTNGFGGRSWIGPVLRMAMLKTHYSQPIDWTVRGLMEAQNEFRSYAEIVRDYISLPIVDDEVLENLQDDLNTADAFTRIRYLRALALKGDIDAGRRMVGSLRTLGFFEYPFGLKFTISGHNGTAQDFLQKAKTQLTKDYPLDLFARQFGKQFPSETNTLSAFAKFVTKTVLSEVPLEALTLETVLRLDAARLSARAAKNWAESDRIRDELDAMGIAIKDNKDGTTTWEVKR